MRILLRYLALFLAPLNLPAESGTPTPAPEHPDFVNVFHRGESGYGGIRIPSLLVTKKGSLLALAEGRRTLGDQSANDIILKRSTDGGSTWSALQVVRDDGEHSLNNPVPVQDHRSGRIFMMFQRYPAGLSEFNKSLQTGHEGPAIVRNLLMTSDDDGVTWAGPVDITTSTKRATGATTLASGPGIGIQLVNGPHRGRMIIPFNEGPAGRWNVYAVYSDDGGDTWKAGENAPGAEAPNAKGHLVSRVNEVQMAELSDGRVMLNTRDEHRTSDCRKVAVSRDGGITWAPVQEERSLPAPPCAASLFRHDTGHLLYSGPDSTRQRHQGTVHVSTDDGRTWRHRRLLEPGFFAYSILARLPDGRVGCLYETGEKSPYETIRLARFPLKWITHPQAP